MIIFNNDIFVFPPIIGDCIEITLFFILSFVLRNMVTQLYLAARHNGPDSSVDSTNYLLKQ